MFKAIYINFIHPHSPAGTFSRQREKGVISKIFLLFFLLFCSFLLSSCGFHLRGFQSIPAGLENIYIESNSPYSTLTLQLKQRLRVAGFNVVCLPQQSKLVLQIIRDDFKQTLMNISANTQTRLYYLTYIVSYQIKTPQGLVVYGPKTVTTNTNFFTNDTQLLGDQDVLQMQRLQLIRDAIDLLFIQLNSAEASQVLAQFS